MGLVFEVMAMQLETDFILCSFLVCPWTRVRHETPGGRRVVHEMKFKMGNTKSVLSKRQQQQSKEHKKERSKIVRLK